MHASETADINEGMVVRSLEHQTSKLPSEVFLWAALGSVGLSLGLHLLGKKDQSNFVGHWVPTFLIFGMYTKLVELHGSEGARHSYAHASPANGHYE